MNKKKDFSYYTFMLLPVVMTIIFVTVIVIPFFGGIGLSFFEWNGILTNPKVFVGFDNFVRLAGDERFFQAGKNTFIFTFFSVLCTNLLGLFLAVVVSKPYYTKNIARTLFFVPHLVGGLLLGFIWKFVFAGPFPKLGEIFQVESVIFNWLLQEKYAMAAIVLVNTWKMAGYIMIIYISGLQSIPSELLEAACVDGATPFQKFRYITIPLLMPAITVTTFITLANSFKIFDVNLSLTAGGPFNSTEMFAINIYNEIFTAGNYGYGQAKAIVFFVLVAAITLLQTYMNKKKEVEM